MLVVADRPRAKVAKGELRTLCAAYSGSVRHHVRTALAPSLRVHTVHRNGDWCRGR